MINNQYVYSYGKDEGTDDALKLTGDQLIYPPGNNFCIRQATDPEYNYGYNWQIQLTATNPARGYKSPGAVGGKPVLKRELFEHSDPPAAVDVQNALDYAEEGIIPMIKVYGFKPLNDKNPIKIKIHSSGLTNEGSQALGISFVDSGLDLDLTQNLEIWTITSLEKNSFNSYVQTNKINIIPVSYTHLTLPTKA